MTDAEILTLIQRALDDVVPDRSDDWKNLTFETTIEDLELDSVATIEMLGFLEEETDRTFPDDEIGLVEGLKDLAVLVRGGTLAD
jgi:acyl carrier protein